MSDITMASLPNYKHEMSTAKAVNDFLATFGKPSDVKKEVIQLWQDQGQFINPPELYDALMQKRIESGEISEKRGAVLKSLFRHSFSREHGTGYLSKHREPIVSGLAQMYATEGNPHPPVWRIEGDISNLGGLNKAMVASAEELSKKNPKAFRNLLAENSIGSEDPEAVNKLGRVIADKVLRTISQMTLKNLEKMAHVVPVRKGGDEISFIATLKPGVSEDEMSRALTETQTEVAQMVISAGLIIDHHKYPNEKRRSGVGIGLHKVNMHLHEPEKLQKILAQGILDSKEVYQDILHRDGILEITTPKLLQVSQFMDALKEFSKPDALPPAPYNLNAPGEQVPDEQRLANLRATLKNIGKTDLTATENRALQGTHKLIRKNDFVTSLPMFEYMQEEQLPYFMKKFGDKNGGAKLVNIDFSNISGGNELGEDVGNVMIKVARNSLLAAMNDSGLDTYSQGISVRPGAKFALLIPANTPKETIDRFTASLNEHYQEANTQPLPFSKASLANVEEKIAGSEKLQKLYGAKGESLFDENGQISMSRIIHLSSQLKGSKVALAVSAEAIDPQASLGAQLKPLETQATSYQDKIIAERKAAMDAEKRR